MGTHRVDVDVYPPMQVQKSRAILGLTKALNFPKFSDSFGFGVVFSIMSHIFLTNLQVLFAHSRVINQSYPTLR